jgi:hypothetical protein
MPLQFPRRLNHMASVPRSTSIGIVPNVAFLPARTSSNGLAVATAILGLRLLLCLSCKELQMRSNYAVEKDAPQASLARAFHRGHYG